MYGIVHDEITARVCVEYFTVFHPPVFHTQSPTLLGIGWGMLATYLVRVLIGMACCAAAFGVFGCFFGTMPAAFAQMIPAELDRRFIADWWAHNASYASGLIGACRSAPSSSWSASRGR